MRATKAASRHADLLSDAQNLLVRSDDLEPMLAKAGARDRTNVQRHIAICDGEADEAHGRLWRRLLGTLGALAPLPFTTAGQQAVLFFIPDGKYRMQVFALEDQRDGVLSVIMPDVLDVAVAQGVISPLAKDGDWPRHYRVGRNKGVQTLSLEPLSAANTPNPPAHVKNMIGWNRRGLRVVLPVSAAEEAVAAVELMAALAALKWSDSAVPAPSPAPAKSS